jgi:hypothetical protein
LEGNGVSARVAVRSAYTVSEITGIAAAKVNIGSHIHHTVQCQGIGYKDTKDQCSDKQQI